MLITKENNEKISSKRIPMSSGIRRTALPEKEIEDNFIRRMNIQTTYLLVTVIILGWYVFQGFDIILKEMKNYKSKENCLYKFKNN